MCVCVCVCVHVPCVCTSHVHVCVTMNSEFSHLLLPKDLNRQVVRADTASLTIPELAFEVPANTQEGSLSTVEGIITRAVEGLEQDQPLRRVGGWVEGEH